jgi:hypothetical protein
MHTLLRLAVLTVAVMHPPGTSAEELRRADSDSELARDVARKLKSTDPATVAWVA